MYCNVRSIVEYSIIINMLVGFSLLAFKLKEAFKRAQLMWTCRPGNSKCAFDCDLSVGEKEVKIYHKSIAKLPSRLAVTYCTVEFIMQWNGSCTGELYRK